MSGKFPNLSRWLWKGKKRDAKSNNSSSLNSKPESNEVGSDVLNYPAIGGGSKLGFSSKRGKRKGRSHEQGKIDKDHDSVVVPSAGGAAGAGAGGSSSDSESDGSDWSIGWSEPHAPGFLSDDEIDSGFGVLVRCYGKQDSNKNGVGGKSHVPDPYVSDSQKHMERWLSSLQNGSS